MTFFGGVHIGVHSCVKVSTNNEIPFLNFPGFHYDLLKKLVRIFIGSVGITNCVCWVINRSYNDYVSATMIMCQFLGLLGLWDSVFNCCDYCFFFPAIVGNKNLRELGMSKCRCFVLCEVGMQIISLLSFRASDQRAFLLNGLFKPLTFSYSSLRFMLPV